MLVHKDVHDLLLAVTHHLTPFRNYYNTFQAPATTDTLVFTHSACGFYMCTLPFILLFLKMMLLQERGVEEKTLTA